MRGKTQPCSMLNYRLESKPGSVSTKSHHEEGLAGSPAAPELFAGLSLEASMQDQEIQFTPVTGTRQSTLPSMARNVFPRSVPRVALSSHPARNSAGTCVQGKTAPCPW